MLKRVGVAFYLISAASSAISFALLMFFLSSCAKKVEGAASGSLPQSASVSVSVSLPTNLMFAPTPEVLERRENFVFGIGAWNLKPFLIAGYLMEDSVLGLGASVIPFSGLRIEYFSVGGDFSYMKIGLRGESSFLGFGGGVGGMYSRDYNFSEKGISNTFYGGNFYGMAHLYTQAEGSSVGFYINLRAGYYHYYSTFLKKVSEQIKQTEDPYAKVKNNFGGLFFTPAIGMTARIVGGRAGLIFELNLPLTAALIFEPDLHPYVPSFNFALVF
jgi:hypothetical protein